jgi:uncharacterized protein YicC (UPF0701 family)
MGSSTPVIEEAIGHLIDFRKQEGAALEKKFREKIKTYTLLLDSVEPFEKERVDKIKNESAMHSKKPLVLIMTRTVEQELIYYIEKLDINEEKQRLNNHLKYFVTTLESGKRTRKEIGFHCSGNGT